MYSAVNFNNYWHKRLAYEIYGYLEEKKLLKNKKKP